MSEQGRKQEDITSHKSSRAATTLTPPPPSLLAYSLPHPPHDYGPHPRLYPMMRPGALAIPPQMAQSIQTAKPCDMGPPIFMPSLNLGTPKCTSTSSGSSPVASSAGLNSITSSVAGAVHIHSMSNMILSNAPSVPEFHHPIPPFYSGSGIRPGPGHMPIPTGAPQVSAVIANKRPPVSSGNIAKPTPVPASHSPKIAGSSYMKGVSSAHSPATTTKAVPLPTGTGGLTNKSLLLTTSSSSGATPASTSSLSQAGSPSFPSGSSVIKQPLPAQPRPSLHLHGHSQHASTVSVHSSTPSYPPLTVKQQRSSNPESVYITHPAMQSHVISVPTYPAMLQAPGVVGTVVPAPPGQPHPTSSALAELLAPNPAVVSSSLRDSAGGGKLGKVHEVGARPFSPSQQHMSTSSRHGPSGIRERSTSGDTGSSGVPSPQTVSDAHANTITSAQPTPNADHTDTRLERPAQPSSGPAAAAGQQLPSPQGVPSPYQGPHRERSNSTEVSNIIISMPGLTGRHIAAIASNQPPGYPPSNSQPQPPLTSHTTSDPYRGVRGKSEYGVDSAPLPPTHPTTLHLIAGSPQVPQNASPVGVGGKLTVPSAPTFGQLASAQSTLTATIISSSSSSVNPTGATPHPNSLPLSSTGSPMTSLSPSRRPGIIRKRPHESSWTGSPNMNKVPFGSLVSMSSPSHTPSRGDNGSHSSHPLSPPHSSTHLTHSEPLTNHISSVRTDSAPPTSDVVPSPRKKRRKQDVIVTDDQYASNVPNNIRPDVAMAMDVDHMTAISPHHQGSSVAMVTRGRGRTDDSLSQKAESIYFGPLPDQAPPTERGERLEVQYLSQLRQPQWPINGLYRTHHRAAHNHFKRHADIKHIEIESVTASDIANDKTSVTRASGWKISRLDPQLEEMLQVERDILETVTRVEKSLSNLSQCTTCTVPSEVLDGLGELVQGNVARSNCIISHFETTRNKMVKVLEHKPTVLDLLMKYSTNKRSSPINSLSHKLRT